MTRAINKNFLEILFWVQILLIAAWVSGCGVSETESISFLTTSETTTDATTETTADVDPEDSVTLSIAFPEDVGASKPGHMSKALGTYLDVSEVTIDVKDGDELIVLNKGMSKAKDKWTVTIKNLPAEKNLSFIAHAYDSSTVEIFTGTTVSELVKKKEDIFIDMAVNEDGEKNTLPRIEKIGKPGTIQTNDTVDICIYLNANKGEKITYELTSLGGSVASESGEIILPGTTGKVVLRYTAPDVAGSFNNKIKITNNQGNSVSTFFPITVTESRTAHVETLFNPVITGIDGYRIGDDVVWTATVVDDGPAEELRYLWAFDGGADFSDEEDNPSTMVDYDESLSGNISLTVTDLDGEGGKTVFLLKLAKDQFPDFF